MWAREPERSAMGASCGRFVQAYKHLRTKKYRGSTHFGKRSEELHLGSLSGDFCLWSLEDEEYMKHMKLWRMKDDEAAKRPSMAIWSLEWKDQARNETPLMKQQVDRFATPETPAIKSTTGTSSGGERMRRWSWESLQGRGIWVMHDHQRSYKNLGVKWQEKIEGFYYRLYYNIYDMYIYIYIYMIYG